MNGMYNVAEYRSPDSKYLWNNTKNVLKKIRLSQNQMYFV